MHKAEVMQDFSWSLINTIFEQQTKIQEGGKACTHVSGMISMQHVLGV